MNNLVSGEGIYINVLGIDHYHTIPRVVGYTKRDVQERFNYLKKEGEVLLQPTADSTGTVLYHLDSTELMVYWQNFSRANIWGPFEFQVGRLMLID